MITIADADFTPQYEDGKVLTQAQLENMDITDLQAYMNDRKDNFVTLFNNVYGNFVTDVDLDLTNSVYDKQTATDSYNGGDINLGTTAGGAYSSVDAVNASLSFTPELEGKYKITFNFSHTITTTATSEGECFTSFRLIDGDTVTASPSVISGGYMAATVANSGKLSIPVSLSLVINYTNTAPKTIFLQKWVRSATNISANVVGATAATGEIYMTVEKI